MNRMTHAQLKSYQILLQHTVVGLRQIGRKTSDSSCGDEVNAAAETLESGELYDVTKKIADAEEVFATQRAQRDVDDARKANG